MSRHPLGDGKSVVDANLPILGGIRCIRLGQRLNLACDIAGDKPRIIQVDNIT